MQRKAAGGGEWSSDWNLSIERRAPAGRCARQSFNSSRRVSSTSYGRPRARWTCTGSSKSSLSTGASSSRGTCGAAGSHSTSPRNTALRLYPTPTLLRRAGGRGRPRRDDSRGRAAYASRVGQARGVRDRAEHQVGGEDGEEEGGWFRDVMGGPSVVKCPLTVVL